MSLLGITGVGLLLFVLTFGLTVYLLPWDNRAYWGTVVSTQMRGASTMPWFRLYVQRANRRGTRGQV